MADKAPKQSDVPFATRINPSKEDLSPEQLHFIRQVELEQWKKKTQKLRTRNVLTGFAIGALVLGICLDGYTFYSVSQERIMDEMDEEAKRARAPKTGAN